jgi:serine/threonine protein kinase
LAKGAPRPEPAASPVEPRQQITIGRYRIKSRLGRGGMGMVYRGVDEALEREVAVKTLTGEGMLEEENRQRFQIEAKAAARLQHPNIVTVYELGEDRGIPFIAMELLPGADLETLLRSGEPLSLQERIDIVVQVCRGLAFAHEHKIVHRDMKPSNIRLLDDGTAKIMDFGIAKLGSTNVTRTGMMVGTMNYMSPEQIRGHPLDGRCDVFAVGVILYQLLTGRRPFVGQGGPDVLYRIVQDPTPPLDVDFGPDTARLQHIVNRALEKEPKNRYGSAFELAEDLQQLQQSLLERTGRMVLSPAEQDAITGARRALQEGRLADAQLKLEPVLARKREAPDVTRLVRALNREQQRRTQPAAPQKDEFPELEATYRAHVTQRTPDTLVAPATEALPARSTAFWLVPVAGVLLLGATVLTLLLLRDRPEPRPSPTQQPTQQTQQQTPVQPPKPLVTPSVAESGPRPTPVPAPPRKLELASDPPGASVTLEGQRQGVTPLQLSLDPAREHRLTLSLEGYATQELKLPAGKVPPSLSLTLVPAGPPGSIAVLASYPVDVLWKGKSLTKGQGSLHAALPPGRHTVSILAPAHFLRKELVVDVKSGAVVGYEAPGLGKINIKANPDNCEVSIDGAFVDYPPILDRPIVEGTHTVGFKWPDGVRREDTIHVVKGKPAFVTGRRD